MTKNIAVYLALSLPLVSASESSGREQNCTTFNVGVASDREDPYTCSGHCYSILEYHGVIAPSVCRKICIDENDGYNMEIKCGKVTKAIRVPSKKSNKNCSKVLYTERVTSKTFTTSKSCQKDCEKVFVTNLLGHYQFSKSEQSDFMNQCVSECKKSNNGFRYKLNIKISGDCHSTE